MRTEATSSARPLGAVPFGEGETHFRVWAPHAREVAVRVDGREHRLDRTDDGYHAGPAPATAGDGYVYVLDGGAGLPDPCSRHQPSGILGESRVVDTRALEWTDSAWPGLSLDDLVVYELHVGTFTADGTFGEATLLFEQLHDLGVTAVEVMPVGEFPGRRGWGYDGVYPYAPHHAYGGPQGFAHLVDAAHEAGLGVILDVVYNHVGPGNRLGEFGPYFTDRHTTFWGDAIDYSRAAVREWAIENALMWVRDYHVDGLRLDATHAVFDDSPEHVLAELARRVKAERPGTLVIAEMETGDLRPIREWGHDAQWADEFHHELHVLLTGERDGYYAAYGTLEGLAGQLRRTPAERLVFCSQNHDQVGNRALGDRPREEELAIRGACLLFAPQTPLLFMGEEYGERRPFQFFTDHVDPFIADATREGRRREFEDFAAFAGADVPDPQDEETFERSKLSWKVDDEIRDLYRELLHLRRELPREVEVEVDEDARTLTLRRGSATLVADFGNLRVALDR